MSVNLLIGAPGGGKSYEAVVYHALAALSAGRMVITNLPLVIEAFAAIESHYPALIEVRTQPQPIRGTFDAERKTMFEISPRENWRPGTGRVFAGVWDYYTDWKHPTTGNGPLFIIDECHLPMPRLTTDKDVAEWYSKHRHFNVDVLLITQSHGKLCADIKDMVQTVYRVRKAISLGQSNCYLRRVTDGIRGDTVAESKREYKPQFFKLYRSHTQGNAVQEAEASDIDPKFKRIRRAAFALIAFSAIAAVFVFPWAIGQWTKSPVSAHGKAQPKSGKPAGTLPQWAVDAGALAGTSTLVVSPNPQQTASNPRPSAPQVPDNPDPFAGKGVHVAGRFQGVMADGSRMDRYIVSVSQNGLVVATYTDSDLAKMGFRYKPFTDCAGTLEFEGKRRAVTCDIPGQSPVAGGAPTGNTQPAKTAEPVYARGGAHDGEVIAQMRSRATP